MMNKKTILGLVVTGVIGGFIGYTIAKQKYEKLIDIEVESVKKSLTEYYSGKTFDKTDGVSKKKTNDGGVVLRPSNVGAIKEPEVSVEDYVDYSKQYRGDSPADDRLPAGVEVTLARDVVPVYVVSPDEYSESFYNAKTLIYYADLVLADEDGYKYDPNSVFHGQGDVILGSFGLYGDEQTTYCVDDMNEIAYEIISDERRFSSLKPATHTIEE